MAYILSQLKGNTRLDLPIEGTEAAYEAYKAMRVFADHVPDLYVALVDGGTGEVLADNQEDL